MDSVEKQAAFSYDAEQLRKLLEQLIQQNTATEVWNWLQEKKAASFHSAFAAVPRKTGKATISLSDEQLKEVGSVRKGFTIQNWTIDRLSRVWLLLQIDASDKSQYVKAIDRLFTTAEMNELVALYSSLPVLAYPEAWRLRCAEGIRSNIGPVLEAIMCDNPYPSEYLDEPAWNQLVLKAFFTEKPVHRIIELDSRVNQNLANILSDYAHERWAAERPVNPLLWRCVGPFLNEQIFPDILRIANSGNPVEGQAAALACACSRYAPAHQLLNSMPVLKSEIENGILTWHTVAVKTMVET